MKRLTTALISLLLLAACNQPTSPSVSTPNPPSKAKGGAKCPGGLTGLECDAYQNGIQAGLADRSNHQSDSFRRHANEFDPQHEASFRAGYATGWYNNGK